MGIQVVWFKRDLRVEDHLPLSSAAQAGPCICLFVYEPEWISSSEFDVSHLNFVNQSLADLDKSLRALGGQLVLRVGRVTDVLQSLHQRYGIANLWSHQETGCRWSYDRDLSVAKWAKQQGVQWHEMPQNGVVRRLKNRDGWSKQREQFMSLPLEKAPSHITPVLDVDTVTIQPPSAFGLTECNKKDLQRGGVVAGQQVLKSFLASRGENYAHEMSSPLTAGQSCSRLSSYLAWGCLSMRQVMHALHNRQTELRYLREYGMDCGGWLKSLRAFESRLSWHCHFMQKLEDEPEIEFQNMSRAYDGLREEEFNEDYFQAWCTGMTGYPLVDACMRSLLAHSWINFRMRAMLVSFASYHLWLHWRRPAVFLARHFLDFEPGIHFSQFQMQSGTTGINTVRIYSPVKQVQDQDPQGSFIRSMVPELAHVPLEYIAQPHKMPLSTQEKVGCIIGKDYPSPIVEHAVAYKQARDRIYQVKKSPANRQESQRVLNKHGSRKTPRR